MESALYYVTMALGVSVIVNLILKQFGVSQIIGYILTGVAVSYLFDLRHLADSHTLELIAEFGVVFLMFTIGLEMSLQRLGTMKRDVFVNGLLQVVVSAVLFYYLAHNLFAIQVSSSIIIAMALSLSSTAVVLSHLKATKEIHRPYGQSAMGILIFQDIAVIPILLLIGFMSSDGEDFQQVLENTAISAVMIVSLLFVIGKRAMTWLLHFSSRSNVEELFMGSVLVIVVGASLLAHGFGFTYSLGAFIAGMIIAETKYHHKVESDIAPFKDLLLGTFFVTVGMKIDLAFFVHHYGEIFALLIGILMIKAAIIFWIIRIATKVKTAMKTAMALAQVGEFSFAIFALAGNHKLMNEQVSQTLVLTVVLSLILTPFILQRIEWVTKLFFKEPGSTDDFSSLSVRQNHFIVCGYSIVGKFVAKDLREHGIQYVIIDNSYKHVQEALKEGEEAYYGDMAKPSILDLLCLDTAAGVIVTLDNLEKKRLICEAILKHTKQVKLVVKVVSLEEKEALSDLPIAVTVDGKKEVARTLVGEALQCKI
ncbi:cation:proton antiporter [Sulfuricurvum sp.]|uniref:cation:proton antiporter n=1 Tax=Sulfuricurvum sp. TaxID=2025608 RepID=UPI00263760FB|nr:cation:proton antiporter [Sulfuricurvum sp.]MDD3594959.1 cation:proton antiporter [Sulfuricurvum sp.]MDD4882883.1 cation:proton antiporter [Sulfuricurvum sp.]